MEQRKSDINTGDGNVINVDNNGLNYSFDFSSQVASDANQMAEPMMGAQQVNQMNEPMFNGQQNGQMVDNVQPEFQPMPEVNYQPEVNAGPMPMPEATYNDVQPAMGPQVMPNEAAPMAGPNAVVTPATTNDVQAVNVNAVPTDVQVNAEQGATVQGEQVANVQGEVQNIQQTQGSDEEIIKDKKATKRFLFIIVGIIVAFIIALPFINKIIG